MDITILLCGKVKPTPMADDSQLTVESSSPEWASVIDRYDDRPNECTIFRFDVPEEGGRSSWITAEEGSYIHVTMQR